MHVWLLSASLCQQASCSLDASVYRVRLSSMWPRTKALLCSAADSSRQTGKAESPGSKAGKEGYLQRMPRPSVRECRRENSSLFISRPWTGLLRGGGWMENLYLWRLRIKLMVLYSLYMIRIMLYACGIFLRVIYIAAFLCFTSSVITLGSGKLWWKLWWNHSSINNRQINQ